MLDDYDYDRVFEENGDFWDLGIEEQAQFISDYYILKIGESIPSIHQPLSSYENILPDDWKDNPNFADWYIMNDEPATTILGGGNSGPPEEIFSDDEDMGDTDTYADELQEKILIGEDALSPLVLDLDGDGIELTSLHSLDAVYFDLDVDEFAEASGWVTGGDGLLTIDLNGDGIVNDNGELFGNGTGFQNGFLALSAYDNNGDSYINNNDIIWYDLKVWVDSNINGRSESDELHRLTDLGISEINLSYVNVNYTHSDNLIKQESTFTINGNEHYIYDVYFKYSNLNSFYVGSYNIEPAIYKLPLLRGYGVLPNLNFSMSLDNDLQDEDSLLYQIVNFSSQDLAGLFTDDDTPVNAVRDIMFR